MSTTFRMLAAAFALLAIGSDRTPAADMSSGGLKVADATTFYRVGRTGIFCVKEPCPWRGVVPADHDGRPRGDVMPWHGDSPPALAADPSDRDRIVAAWKNLECLLIEGRFAGKTLEVSRIVGRC